MCRANELTGLYMRETLFVSSIQLGGIGKFCPFGIFFYLGVLKHFELKSQIKKFFTIHKDFGLN